MKKITTLLSLDTSSTSTGWAVFINGEYVRSGCIDLKQIKDINVRLPEMIRRIYSLIDDEFPDIIVTEEMVVPRNAQAARILTMILGAVYGYCISYRMEYEVDGKMLYSSLRPTEWRKLIDSGKKPRDREGLKNWSKQKVAELGIVVDEKMMRNPDDVTDAILIGKAYCNRWNNAI